MSYHLRAMGLMSLIAACFLSAEAVANDAIPVSRPKPITSVRIGMNRNMFRDIPTTMLTTLAKPMQKLLESQTGLTGDVEMCPDACCLAQRVYDGNIQIGVFHGFELAWLRQHYTELEPLIVAVPASKKLQACLVTRKDSGITDFTGLEGKIVAIGKGTKEHCRLFLDRGRNTPERSMRIDITAPETVEDALHDVVDGVVAATVVDSSAMTSFASRNPGRANKLKIVTSSEHFPLGVIAYRRGSIDDGTLARIRTGLASAQSTSQGKAMMQLWKLGGFEAVPPNYNEQLVNILKLYPAPPDLLPMK